MLWFIQSLIAIILLATLPLFNKKVSLLSHTMRAPAYLGALFAGMAVCMVPYLLISGQAFYAPGTLELIAIAAGLASVIANVTGFTTALRASNVGYPYTIFQILPFLLILIGVVFFGQSVTPVQLLAVVAAFGGAVLVILTTQQEKHKQSTPWLHLTITWLLFGAVMISLNKYLATKGVSPATTLFTIFWVAALGCIFGLRQYRVLRTQPTKIWYIVAAAAVIGTIGNTLLFFAYATAPNQGFPAALNSASPFIMAVGARFLFRQSIDRKAVLGFCLTILGAILLVTG